MEGDYDKSPACKRTCSIATPDVFWPGSFRTPTTSHATSTPNVSSRKTLDFSLSRSQSKFLRVRGLPYENLKCENLVVCTLERWRKSNNIAPEVKKAVIRVLDVCKATCSATVEFYDGNVARSMLCLKPKLRFMSSTLLLEEMEQEDNFSSGLRGNSIYGEETDTEGTTDQADESTKSKPGMKDLIVAVGGLMNQTMPVFEDVPRSSSTASCQVRVYGLPTSFSTDTIVSELKKALRRSQCVTDAKIDTVICDKISESEAVVTVML